MHTTPPTLKVRWQDGTDAQTNADALTYGYIREFLETDAVSPADTISTDIIDIIINFNRATGIYMDCSARGFKWSDIGDILEKVMNPNDIYPGYQRMAIKTMDNKMLITGNVWGQSTLTDDTKPFDEFKEIPQISNKGEIYLISQGTKARQTIVVTTQNKIYCFGPNHNGEFGNGKRNETDIEWTGSNPEVHDGPSFNDVFDSKLVKIHGTSRCTFWLSKNGKLYQSGYIKRDKQDENENAKGVKEKTDRFVLFPVIISVFEKYKVVDITSGNSFVLCLCDNGKVFAWGNNAYGQCGVTIQVDDDNPRINKPMFCKLLAGYNIKQIACGGTHSVVIDEEGTALLFGNNDCGQIGNGDYDMTGYGKVYVTYPHRLRIKVRQAAAGANFTLIASDSNKLYFMGCHFDHPVEPYPKMVQIENTNINNGQIVKIYAWYFYSMVWMEK